MNTNFNKILDFFPKFCNFFHLFGVWILQFNSIQFKLNVYSAIITYHYSWNNIMPTKYNFCTFFPRYNKPKKVGKRHLCEHKMVDIKRQSAFHNIGGPDSVTTVWIIGLNCILLATTIQIGKSNKIGLQLNTIFCKLIQFFAS